MSEREHFLSRWSRRKREVVDTPSKSTGESGSVEAELEAQWRAGESATDGAPAQDDADAGSPAQPSAPAPAFDPASLPPIESITADTDISGFLAPGVPNDLKLAALRRAWSADPLIRDFVGLQEYDWDFNTPGAVPGFGDISPEDVKKLAAKMFGEADAGAAGPQAEASPQAGPSPHKDVTSTAGAEADRLPRSGEVSRGIGETGPESGPAALRFSLASPDAIEAGRQTENAASQNKAETGESAPAPRRRHHGGALPE